MLKCIVSHHGWPTKFFFQILDALEWLKQLYFDLSDSLLIASALKIFLFPLYFTFFLFATQKSRGEGRGLTPSPPCAASPGPNQKGVIAVTLNQGVITL